MKFSLMILLLIIQTSGSKRILDIYTPDKSEKNYQEQIRLLTADPKGLRERDVIIQTHTGHSAFKIVLTGKDGGEKYRFGGVLSLEKLYAIIDAMPMSKAEKAKSPIH